MESGQVALEQLYFYMAMNLWAENMISPAYNFKNILIFKSVLLY